MVEKFTFSGLWRRLFAYLIDICLLFVLFSLLMICFLSRFYLAVFLGLGFSFTLLGWLYWAFLESSSLQATLGKRLMRLKVVDEKGEKLSFQRASLRFFGKWLSAAFFWLGFIMIAFSKKKQGLHDKLASTYVIRNNGFLA